MKLKVTMLDAEIPIFIDTNLGTHLVLTAAPDITAADLKCKLVEEHRSTFASFGEIKVHALMVKRRSYLYHLPDTMPVKNAFQGFAGTWSLQMRASRLQDLPQFATSMPSIVEPTGVGSFGLRGTLEPVNSNSLPLKGTQKIEDQLRQLSENKLSVSSDSDGSEFSQSETVIAPEDKSRGLVGEQKQLEVLPVSTPIKKDDNRNARHLLSGRPFESKKAPSVNASKEVSVTGIITRYFSDSDEINSCQKQHISMPEGNHTTEIVGSTMWASEYSANQKVQKRMVGSDTDTVCSINNVTPSDRKQFKAKQASIRGYRKAKKATGTEARNKASRSRRNFQSPYAIKLQIGKKLIQAANNISISGSGKKLSKSPLMSRHAKLSGPEPNVLVRHLAFEIDDLDY